MGESRKFESVSVSDFRNLAEAPISSDSDEENDPLHQVTPSGEALESNAFYEQGNKYGGQTQQGEAGRDYDAITDDASEPRQGFEEILETDLESELNDDDVHSPETSDMNVPGEIDIEGLDEDALDGTDIPADARLDRLEE